ncbi:hypothetical protein MMC30_004887 [Trapelia coarctata]|nr:hypothetical protein [Trapelia coarctata]
MSPPTTSPNTTHPTTAPVPFSPLRSLPARREPYIPPTERQRQALAPHPATAPSPTFSPVERRAVTPVVAPGSVVESPTFTPVSPPAPGQGARTSLFCHPDPWASDRRRRRGREREGGAMPSARERGAEAGPSRERDGGAREEEEGEGEGEGGERPRKRARTGENSARPTLPGIRTIPEYGAGLGPAGGAAVRRGSRPRLPSLRTVDPQFDLHLAPIDRPARRHQGGRLPRIEPRAYPLPGVRLPRIAPSSVRTLPPLRAAVPEFDLRPAPLELQAGRLPGIESLLDGPYRSWQHREEVLQRIEGLRPTLPSIETIPEYGAGLGPAVEPQPISHPASPLLPRIEASYGRTLPHIWSTLTDPRVHDENWPARLPPLEGNDRLPGARDEDWLPHIWSTVTDPRVHETNWPVRLPPLEGNDQLFGVRDADQLPHIWSAVADPRVGEEGWPVRVLPVGMGYEWVLEMLGWRDWVARAKEGGL